MDPYLSRAVFNSARSIDRDFPSLDTATGAAFRSAHSGSAIHSATATANFIIQETTYQDCDSTDNLLKGDPQPDHLKFFVNFEITETDMRDEVLT